MKPNKTNRKHNLDSWDSSDVHSGQRKFIKGGGRKSNRPLKTFESKKTQLWDELVEEWIKNNS